MSGRCHETIRLTDYGNQRCGKPDGHAGPHQVSSPYDSRDIKWVAESRTVMDNLPAVGAPKNWRWGYLPCGCRNDGHGGHA